MHKLVLNSWQQNMRYKSLMRIISYYGIQILNIHLVVVMHTLLVGFCPRIFLDTLYVDPLANKDELHNQATRYINIKL